MLNWQTLWWFLRWSSQTKWNGNVQWTFTHSHTSCTDGRDCHARSSCWYWAQPYKHSLIQAAQPSNKLGFSIFPQGPGDWTHTDDPSVIRWPTLPPESHWLLFLVIVVISIDEWAVWWRDAAHRLYCPFFFLSYFLPLLDSDEEEADRNEAAGIKPGLATMWPYDVTKRLPRCSSTTLKHQHTSNIIIEVTSSCYRAVHSMKSGQLKAKVQLLTSFSYEKNNNKGPQFVWLHCKHAFFFSCCCIFGGVVGVVA